MLTALLVLALRGLRRLQSRFGGNNFGDHVHRGSPCSTQLPV